MNFYEFREREKSGVAAETEELAQRVIGAAIEVHKHMGPRLPEAAYRRALCPELSLRKITFRTEVSVSLYYKGICVGEGRIDVLVDEVLVLELKATESLSKAHASQALTYLASARLQLALLINFNVSVLRDGIKRVINSRA